MSQRFIARLAAFTSIVAGFLTFFALTLALAPRADAFVYWGAYRDGGDTIGRANLDGTGVNNRFITSADGPEVAVDAAHLYWTNHNTDTIGRAKLDGTGVDQSFITGATGPVGIAVDGAHVYWANSNAVTIGRANLDGTGVDQSFIVASASGPVGIAVDGTHVYWTAANNTIGRANLDGTGVDQSFITGGVPSGLAVDAAHVYWANNTVGTIGRANLDGTGVDQSFIPLSSVFPLGVAVDASHIYWAEGGSAIGRANLDGTGVDNRFITGAGRLSGVAVDALRSFSFGKVKRNKEKGTAKLAVKVPGPGEVHLAETEGMKPDRKRAEAAGKVKLAIKPRGEAKKKLKRRGKVKVEAEVSYTPRSGNPTIVANTLTKTVKLVKR